jgi:hypothetical protein
VPPLLISAALGVMALSGLPVLYGPIAIELLLAVIGTFAMLGMTLLGATINRSRTVGSWSELAPLAATAIVAAVSVIATLAGVRLLLERVIGLPALT